MKFFQIRKKEESMTFLLNHPGSQAIFQNLRQGGLIIFLIVFPKCPHFTKRGKSHGSVHLRVKKVVSLIWMKCLMTISLRTMKQLHFLQKPTCKKEDWKR